MTLRCYLLLVGCALLCGAIVWRADPAWIRNNFFVGRGRPMPLSRVGFFGLCYFAMTFGVAMLCARTPSLMCDSCSKPVLTGGLCVLFGTMFLELVMNHLRSD